MRRRALKGGFGMVATTRSVDFAEAATEFCAWCAGSPSSEVDEARIALRHLARLHLLAQELRELEDVQDLEAERPDDPAWRAVYERFGSLPFNDYAKVFDPRSDDISEVVTGKPGRRPRRHLP